MPFAWTAISLREILKEIEQETNLSSHINTIPANAELVNSLSKASSLGNQRGLVLSSFHWILLDIERKSIGAGGLRNAYESFRRSRDESLTRNNSRKSDDRPMPTTSPTSTSSSTNINLPTVSDEFFHILANFDRPIVITLKGVFQQVKFPNLFSSFHHICFFEGK